MAIDWTKVITISDEDTVDVTCGKEVLYVRGSGSGGSGGPAIWGAIIGDIEDQDDLMDALDTKADASAVNAKADKDIIAGEFSASTAYAIGDYVVYEGDLYRFTAAHSAGAWSGSDAVMITVSAELKTKLSDAPSDDKIYGRKNGAWTETATGYKKVKIYVDPTNTGDVDADGSSAHPFWNFNQAVSVCPERTEGEATVYVAAGTTNGPDVISIRNKKIMFMIQGDVTIQTADQTWQGYNILNSISMDYDSEVTFSGGVVNLSMNKPISILDSNLYVSLAKLTVDMTGSSFGDPGISVGGANAVLRLTGNYYYTGIGAQGSKGINCYDMARAYAYNVFVTNTYTGFQAKDGATIAYGYLNGTVTEQTHTENGGRVYTGAQ